MYNFVRKVGRVIAKPIVGTKNAIANAYHKGQDKRRINREKDHYRRDVEDQALFEAHKEHGGAKNFENMHKHEQEKALRRAESKIFTQDNSNLKELNSHLERKLKSEKELHAKHLEESNKAVEDAKKKATEHELALKDSKNRTERYRKVQKLTHNKLRNAKVLGGVAAAGGLALGGIGGAAIMGSRHHRDYDEYY